MKRFWISWEEYTDIHSIIWPLESNVIGVWCSGQGEDYYTMVALVQGKDKNEITEMMERHYPECSKKEWRFFDEVDKNFDPGSGGRFPVIPSNISQTSNSYR